MPSITRAELKSVREQFNLSQREFARVTGVPQSSLSRFECGEGVLSEENEAKVRVYIKKLHQPDLTGLVDEALIDTTVKQVIEQMLDSLDSIVEAHIAGVRIPSSKLASLFKKDYTLTEVEEVISTASLKLTQEAELTIRSVLEDYSNSL